MFALVAGVVDEQRCGVGLVTEDAEELDQRRHAGLVVLLAVGGLHAGEGVEDERARPDA